MKNVFYRFVAILLLAGIVLGLRSYLNSSSREAPVESEIGADISPTPVDELRDASELTGQNQSNPSSELEGLEDCLDACLKSLFNSVLFSDDLSVTEMNRIVEDTAYLKRFLRFHPDIIPDIGTFLATADVGDEGGDSYDEDLDNRVMLMEDVVSYLETEDLKTAALTMINSEDKAVRESSLKFIEIAFQAAEDQYDEQMDFKSPPPEAALKIRSELAALVPRFLEQESSPEQQLKAIDILSRNSPENMTDQIIGQLSSLSTQHQNPAIRGKAMVLSAASARPDSLVLSQISDELSRSNSDLQTSALLGLDISLRHLSKDDTIMADRLKEFRPELETLITRSDTDPEIREFATFILKKL